MTELIFEFDKQYSPSIIAGADEAGRGPLAGPVVCACCIMPLDNMIDKINDSKQVSESMRYKLYDKIIESAIDFRVGIIDHEIIDKINILQATKLGFKMAIESLEVVPDIILIDAVTKLDITCKYESIVKGDAKSYNIAAASIIAKVTRDRLMADFDRKYPQYGFSHNKGYGTQMHINALKKFGKSEIHRLSFIKNFMENNDEEQA